MLKHAVLKGLVPALVVLLAGCASQGPATGPSGAPLGGTCNAQPAQSAVGKNSTAKVVEAARVRSGAITMALFVYVMVNGGMITGMLPVVGVPLPLMSYGGSAILLNMIALAVVMRIDYENRILMKRGSV